MQTSILLLRGINVGGKNKLAMKDLVAILESLGLEDVRTYIQSGNVVFQSARKPNAKLKGQISSQINQLHGFEPQLMVLSNDQLQAAIASNPFGEATADPKSLHFYFLQANSQRIDADAIERVKTPTEQFHVGDRVFYLHAPEGIGRSKLAARVERLLGVPATGRNWRTISKLAAMAEPKSH